ncbi:MAG TPA: hypothetical protein VGM90_24555 [Kofleriaceae bacterium]
MRSGGIALFGGLLGLAGCNQIFGLDAVILVDAGPDSLPIDAAPPTVSLTTITPTLGVSGQPTHAVEYHSLSPAPRIEYGEIGGPLSEHPYEDGVIHIPYEYPGRADDWRLVYTPDGGVPHEVQWHPADGKGFFTEVVGADRGAVPAGAMLGLTPNNPMGTGVFAGPFTKPRVYMTNAWAETRQPTVAGTTVTVDYNAAGTVSQLGPRRAVGPTDDVMLVDFVVSQDTNNGCQASQGAVPFQFTVAASTTAIDASPPPWSSSVLNSYALTSASLSTALVTAYPPSTATVRHHKVYGLVPTAAVPLFQGHTELGIPLPLPLGADLIECDMLLTATATNPVAVTLPDFDAPKDSTMLGAGTIQFALTRSPAMAPDVSIGFAATVVADTSVTSYSPQFTAPIAVAPTIDGLDATVPEQLQPSTPVTLTATTSPATLAFTTAPAGAVADFFEATLYTLQGSTLVPVREFTFHASPLRFDRDLLVPGQLYIFEVRGISGAPNAAMGDFRVWTANQAISRTFTQTFQR